MTKRQMDIIELVADDLVGEYRGAYSGRGMYGKATCAIVVDDTRTLIEVAERVADYLANNEEEEHFTCSCFRIDGMGLSVVVY